MLSEATGTAANPGGPLTASRSRTGGPPPAPRQRAAARLCDLQQGLRPADRRSEGNVTTTLKDGQPKTTMKGKYAIVSATGALAGTQGEGSYSGYFTAEDKYHVDWEGSRSGARRRLARTPRSDFVNTDRTGALSCAVHLGFYQPHSFVERKL